MGKTTGFMEFDRELPRRRPVRVRVRDWREVYEPFSTEKARHQGGRCMDCGIPFCHEGCPLGNLIPEWNDLVWRDDWSTAIERLHATNNFPEFTGRLCPAPCEAACVLGINAEPVTIERIEYEIAERAWTEGWVTRQIPRERTGKRVGIVGSGPAGLACAQQLCRAGHEVTVFERAEKPGGLLRYGIPEFKMQKRVLDRRLTQLSAEGVQFRCSTLVGLSPETHPTPEPGLQRGLGTANSPTLSVVSAYQLSQEFDALVLAGGSTVPRDLMVSGRSLNGVHFAMEYLKPANLVREGALSHSPIDGRGKHVIIIGGGDTGADCLGTAHRQGAATVTQLEILPEPPPSRPAENPWPTWPVILRTSSAHEEGGRRMFAVSTTELLDDGHGAVRALRGQEVAVSFEGGRPQFHPMEGKEFELPADLVLLALGFTGAERSGVVAELGIELSPTGTVAVDQSWSTNLPGIFACGDMARGQSLVVWAIAEGRSAAASVDQFLMGETALPAPLRPGQLALR